VPPLPPEVPAAPEVLPVLGDEVEPPVLVVAALPLELPWVMPPEVPLEPLLEEVLGALAGQRRASWPAWTQ
jgi:hypothetical protein